MLEVMMTCNDAIVIFLMIMLFFDDIVVCFSGLWAPTNRVTNNCPGKKCNCIKVTRRHSWLVFSL